MTLRSGRVHGGPSDDHAAGVDGCPICDDLRLARTCRLAPVLTVRVRAALAAALLGVASAGPPGALASVRPTEQNPPAAAHAEARLDTDAPQPRVADATPRTDEAPPASPAPDAPGTQPGPDPTDLPLDNDAPLVDPDETLGDPDAPLVDPDETTGGSADEPPAPTPATGPAPPSPAEVPPTTPSDAAPPAGPPSVQSPPAATSPPVAPFAPPAPAAAPHATAPAARVALLPDLTLASTPVIESIVEPSAAPTGTRASDPPPTDPSPSAADALPLSSVATVPPLSSVATAPPPATSPGARTAKRSAAAAARRGDRVHVVAPGESLWSIATSALGKDATTWQLTLEVDRLWTLNAARMRTGDPDLLLVGTRLRLR